MTQIYAGINWFTIAGEADKLLYRNPETEDSELTYMGCVCIVMVFILGKNGLFFSNAKE